MCDQQSLRSACAYAQSDQSLCLSLEYSITVKLLTEHHLEFLRLKGGCTGSSESKHVKMPLCCKLHATALLIYYVPFVSLFEPSQQLFSHARTFSWVEPVLSREGSSLVMYLGIFNSNFYTESCV